MKDIKTILKQKKPEKYIIFEYSKWVLIMANSGT